MKNALIKIGSPIVIFALAMGVSKFLQDNGPEAEKKESVTNLLSVEYVRAKVADYQMKISSRGNVEAAKSSTLSAEVGGLVKVHAKLEVGEVFEKGDELLKIDEADFLAAFAQADSQAAQAEVDVQTEESRAAQARRDWKKLGGDRKPDPLVLREPQLAAAQARYRSALAARDKAQRDLERTSLKAPYRCRVTRVMVDDGALATPGAAVVSIESADDYEVALPLTLEEYGLLETQSGKLLNAPFQLSVPALGIADVWMGDELRSEGIVDRETRSINVVAKVPTASREGGAAMLTGAFVNAEITGKTVNGVVVLPREALVDQRQVLTLDDEDKLQFRTVRVLRYQAGNAIISEGLADGDRVVITALESAFGGQEVDASEYGVEPESEETEDGGAA